MTPDRRQGTLDGVPAPATPDRSTERPSGSPAAVVSFVSGLLGLLLSLNTGGLAVSLFFSAVALAALPLALADRPGARTVRFVLLGGAMAVLGLVLALVPQLTGEDQRADRTGDPLRVDDRPAVPERVRTTPSASSVPTG